MAKNLVSVDTYFHVRRTVAAMQSIWEKTATDNNTKIEAVFGANIPDCLPLDTIKIQHCLNNLVGNAVKNTLNGLVRIIVSSINMTQSPKSNTKNNTDNNMDHQQSFIALSVQDSGRGIPPNQLNTLFERNDEANAPSQQTYGVVDTGLPMTHDLITELGGKVRVKSHPGKGSIFSLLLPYTPAMVDIGSVANIQPSTPINNYTDINILVVDDYNLNQLTIKTLLHDHIGKIFTANHGYEALDILHSCPVDIVLMDIHMPVLDGIETTIKIRESGRLWAGVRIVAMTADPQYQQTRLYQKIGMDDALAKPYRKDDLLAVLEQFEVPYKTAI